MCNSHRTKLSKYALLAGLFVFALLDSFFLLGQAKAHAVKFSSSAPSSSSSSSNS